MSPLLLLFTLPFNLYLIYHLLSDSHLLCSYLGLAPYLWGVISISGCIARSRDSVEELSEVSLNKAKQRFDRTKDYFRNVIISTIVFFIILTIVSSHYLISFNRTSLFNTVITSIISVDVALYSFFIQSNAKRIFMYFCFVFAVEAGIIVSTLQGLWMLEVIYLAGSFIGLYLGLRRINRYGLRDFFEMIVN